MSAHNEHNNLSFFMLSHIAARGRLKYEDYLQAWEMAMADGKLDEKERRILQRLFELLPPDDVPEEFLVRIDEIRNRYDL